MQTNKPEASFNQNAQITRRPRRRMRIGSDASNIIMNKRREFICPPSTGFNVHKSNGNALIYTPGCSPLACSLWLYQSVAVCLSLTGSICLCVYLSVPFCLCDLLSMCLSMPACLCKRFCAWLSGFVSLSVFLCLCVCVTVY